MKTNVEMQNILFIIIKAESLTRNINSIWMYVVNCILHLNVVLFNFFEVNFFLFAKSQNDSV